MILSIIVAAAENDVIGKSGDMAWHLPAEMTYFRQTTVGHPVIMGRVTHESIGRALPDRLNIVITSDKEYKAPGCVVVNSLKAALALPEVRNADEVFIIGGQSVNEQALPRADKLYLTRVHAKIEGDKYFHYNPEDWELVWSEKHQADAENKYPFEFMVFERKSK